MGKKKKRFTKKQQEKADKVLGIDPVMALVRNNYNISDFKNECNKSKCKKKPKKEATIKKNVNGKSKELASVYVCDTHAKLDSFEKKLNKAADKGKVQISLEDM